MFFYKSRKYGTCLQTIMDGIDNLNNDLGFNKPNSISIMKKIELRKYIEHCQKFIVSSPNILMNLEEFSSLSKNDKGIIFSLFRGNAFILLIADYTLKLYDPFSTPKPLLIIDSSTMFNVDDIEFIEPDISQKASNEAYNLYKPSLIFACEHVLKPMKILNFEKIEIAYMILQIIFSNVVLEKTSKECRRVADCLLKIANNELHNYYIFNKKITNYAYRLSEMTKLLYTIKEYCEREKEVVLLAKWLNILDLSFISGV
uniref:NR LBD domain-containing protein n=1 Tax=Parastrongyloides trichosuri TaxID=131310 RepID=A0A0N4Z4T2_PARTI